MHSIIDGGSDVSNNLLSFLPDSLTLLTVLESMYACDSDCCKEAALIVVGAAGPLGIA